MKENVWDFKEFFLNKENDERIWAVKIEIILDGIFVLY